MSITRSLTSGESDEFIVASQKLELLEIPVDLNLANKLHQKFTEVGRFRDPKKVSAGVKGLDLAFRACLILAGKEDHEKVPVFVTEDPVTVSEICRPFNFFVAKDYKITHAAFRGFRMGLYVLANASPLIEYEDSGIPEGDIKIVARSKSTDAVLVGQHLTPSTSPHFEPGFFGAFPAEAERVYSFAVQNLVSVTSV